MTGQTIVNTLARWTSSGTPRTPSPTSTRVGFPEAVTVLEDELALTREDPDAVDEQRFVALGTSGLGRLLVVVYTYRDPDKYRIISAWKANRRQRSLYEKTRR